MKASDFDLELDELYKKSVGRLMNAEVFDLQAFNALKDYLSKKSELIKAEHVISKQVVKCLLSTAQVIESNAEHVSGARENLTLAADFHMILGILAWGQACSDFEPGKPRIS